MSMYVSRMYLLKYIYILRTRNSMVQQAMLWSCGGEWKVGGGGGGGGQGGEEGGGRVVGGG